MPAAPLPLDEIDRLKSLYRLHVLDTAPEQEFDALVEAAALTCGVPISLISLIDEGRQWFKANVGLPGVTETPRDLAFCAHAILQEGIFEIPDAALDPRFAENELVTSDPNIRFYAGAPLKLNDGTHAGTLCVIDRQPRKLDETQRDVLRHLARAAVQALEGRRALKAERELGLQVVAASASLGESQARFRALSDASPLGVFATDQEGNCTYTNAKWQEIYGLSLADSLGKGWASTLHPDDKGTVFGEWQRAALSGGEFDMEFRILHPSGGERYVRSRARAVQSSAGQVTGYVGSVEDVTEARAIQVRLLAKQRRLAGVIEGTGVGTWEWNLQTGQVSLNEKGMLIAGSCTAQFGTLRANHWRDSIHPDDRKRAETLLEKHVAEGTERYECELRVRQPAGGWIWILERGRVLSWTADGKPEWMFGTQLDITARKEQEEALRKSEALMNRTGEVAGVGGWELDLASGSLMWTAQTRIIHGVPPDYTPTLDTAINFYAPEARPAIQAAVQRSMATGQGWDLELPLVRADGTPIWVRAVGGVEFEGDKPVRLLGAFQDITQRRALHTELADQHELLKVTLQSIGDAVITTDRDGRVTWLNPVAERMTGWINAEAIGQPVGIVFHIVNEETREPTENPVATCLDQGKVAGLANHTVLISRQGEEFGIEDSAAPIRSEGGEILGVVLVFHDVTEQRRLSGEMTFRATHDALTGLVNRAEFESRLRRVLNKAHEDRSEHALMYLDLDQFKLVNDACGHSVGDQLLQQVSKLLAESVRARDTLARLGGDEFAVILEHCSADQAQRVAQQICERMDDFRFVHDGKRFRIGASVGLVPLDHRWGTAAAVMQAADTSCYAAKEAGRNRVHAWFDTDAAMRARHGEMQWASRIEQALDENLFVLYAQRITSLGDPESGVHAEVLLRMQDSDGNVVMPGAFLPAAERFHLASRVDRWVLKAVIDYLHVPGVISSVSSLNVNLSGQSIGDRAFHRQALEMLEGAGEAICRSLCLEITETAAVTNMADAAVFIQQVRALGIKVALDDFGAGASSFGYLKSLPVDYIKIDGQFIRDVVDDPLDEAAVRCFVDVARVVGVKTVAEFVDRPAVKDMIRAIGVDFAQGYLLHRPQALAALVEMQRVEASAS
ncbi:EAL domain-containing protein [Roseateles sp. DXS20W]|uniref:EAL domain-containing protein n=1 Tax=Pelomonas lactea TaxID=3299030 RepID=A0ABW7GJA5_9BURK